MRHIEACGLADGRWKLIADTTFAKRVAWDGGSCALFCYPDFVKLR
ncbi:MAG: hypothetical protein IKF56_01015 [Eggerthellaceae bacterium]|nr:hypothetical protein [Eggerthellaceae bacterium]